jgi:hypothetical protein
MKFNDPALFAGAIAGFVSSTESFDSTAAGTPIADGVTLNSLTFSYSFTGPPPYQLAVTDGDEYGGTLPAPTTSAPNFLATTLDDLLVGGDDFTLTFAPSNAIGLYVISAEAAGSSLFDNDLLLTVAGESTPLDVDIRTDLGDGSFAYFLGLVNGAATFSSASLTTAPIAVGSISYVVDDITLATGPAAAPAPASLLLVLTGLAGAGVLRRRRRC